jgi:hypothetical protein
MDALRKSLATSARGRRQESETEEGRIRPARNADGDPRQGRGQGETSSQVTRRSTRQRKAG